MDSGQYTMSHQSSQPDWVYKAQFLQNLVTDGDFKSIKDNICQA